MASSCHFDAFQTYDGFNSVEILNPPLTECFINGVPLSNIKRYLWRKKDGPFGKEFPVSEAPNPDYKSGYSSLTGSRQREVENWTNVGGPMTTGGRPIYSSSEVFISIINNQGVVKRIRKIADSPTNPDAEGSEKFDGEEVEVINPLVGHSSSTSPIKPPSKKLHSHLIPNNQRNVLPFLSLVPTSIPPPLPGLS
ncbi:hypothetical protein O181_002187 [Austropuccinia psidii MF-1]|uniref:Uncharacterized protein n=1 Tax=Austropuccinia psidii MF-1 TaxID=1389203 RepID=A0A9Q3BC00_9BASI|nr:hypothetical protein [Austropuccinia psidii MF-1]